MCIGILGSGLMGGTLGTLFARAGCDVPFSYARSERKLKRPSLLYSGDDAAAKKVAAGLIRDVGFDPVDAGLLRMARDTEPFTLLVARLAHETGDGPELAYRFERYARPGRKSPARMA